MLPKDNLWAFRIEYIVAHYAWSGLKTIQQHYISNNSKGSNPIHDIDSLLVAGRNLFPSSFRNCMMHYGLKNDLKNVIQEKNFDMQKPFFGLVESCFDGKSYDQFVLELNKYLMMLEEWLSSMFYIDIRKIQWD
jgi:hypothetical protein